MILQAFGPYYKIVVIILYRTVSYRIVFD